MLSLNLPYFSLVIRVVLLAVTMENSLLHSSLWQAVVYLKRSMSPISIFIISSHRGRKDAAVT